MIRSRGSALCITILSATLLLVSGAFAADASNNGKRPDKVAKISAGPTVVQWDPLVDHERLLLTVSTPWGEVWSKEFPSGKNPTFRLQDVPGRVIDGTYTWQLRVAPKIDPRLQKEMERLRAAGDEAALLRLRAEAGLSDELLESGGFTILNGTFVSPDLVEPDAGDSSVSAQGTTSGTEGFSLTEGSVRPLDIVQNDDLIVTRSLCVGFDCVNGESFGFDTIRMKENNTRVAFVDTSTTSGFPTTDWELTANDSASGGLNRFSILDRNTSRNVFTAEGGAANNSIYIGSTGRVGFRTSTPVLDLHVSTTNTPGMRLEQTNAGGFTAQTWDIAGNEANFFIRDVTGGSRLPFRIRPGAPTSSLDINRDGDIGIGTASPSSKVHVLQNADVNTLLTVENSNAGPTAAGALRAVSNAATVNFQAHGSGRTISRFGQTLGSWNEMLSVSGTGLIIGTLGDTPLILGTNNTNRVHIKGSGFIGIGTSVPGHPLQMASGAHVTAGGVWTNASSRVLKTDVRELDAVSAFETLALLDPVVFRYLSEDDELYVGFIAEDVPELVAASDRKTLSPMDVVAVLTKVVQEQNVVVQKQNEMIEQQRRSLEELLDRVNALEQRTN